MFSWLSAAGFLFVFWEWIKRKQAGPQNLKMYHSRNVFNPFPHLDTLSLQQTNFKNIVTKGEIAQYKQFPLMSQCFQLYKKSYPFIERDFSNLCLDIFKVVCSRFVLCWKGLISHQNCYFIEVFLNNIDLTLAFF